MKGIYQYTDLETGDVVYVGKDSHIDKNQRHKAHLFPSQYGKQPFNSIIQNNPDRYQYEIVYAGDFDNDLLNVLEVNTIVEEQPLFNFTSGGDGAYTISKETREKMSESAKKRLAPMEGKKHTEESKQKISVNNAHYWKGKKRPKRTKEHCKKISDALKGRKHSKEFKEKISKANKEENNPLWKNYARIISAGTLPNGKQRYRIRFNGRNLKSSINLNKLIKWFKENYPDEQLVNEVNT